jgi:two-component system, NtrC family, response regulator HydG
MNVLFVDPEESSRDGLRRALSALACPARGFGAFPEAEASLAEFDPDVVIADFDADRERAAAFLSGLRGSTRSRSVFALVDQDTLDRAVHAIADGADDFLLRPISEARLSQLLETAAARRERDEESEATRLRLAHAELHDALPGRSPRWTSALAVLERVARSGGSVLLAGESGTEKDAAALAIHRLSARGAARFAYISEGESIDLATGQRGAGTLFLPNVEAASLGYQEMLLSRLEHAGTARFVVGIDEDPGEAVSGGRLLPALRQALFGGVVHLPPLRERDGDAAILAERLLEDVDPGLAFDPEALDVLRVHDWPGNAIELKEVVRRAARLSEGTVGPLVVRSVLARPLPRTKLRRRKPPVVRIAVGDSLADVERRMISKTLEFARGNKKKTAELLKLSLKTIYNKIKEYGLEH